MHNTALHDEIHGSGRLDIAERITGQRDQVGGRPSVDAAEVGTLQKVRGKAGRCAQSTERRIPVETMVGNSRQLSTWGNMPASVPNATLTLLPATFRADSRMSSS